MHAIIRNFLHSGHIFGEGEEAQKYQCIFLNNVIGFAAIVAFFMGFARFGEAYRLMGSIDWLFSLIFVLLLFRLRGSKNRIKSTARALIVSAYLLFTAIYLLAPNQSTRLELYYLLVASAFFLEGRRHGFYWLFIVLATLLFFHFTPFVKTGFSHLDLLSSSVYLVALFFILNLYEDVKNGQSAALHYLNSHLEALVAQRTKELEISNRRLEEEKALLHSISVTDQLTGLHNRFQIREFYRREQARAAREQYPLSIIMIDIDHFKSINDSYGHLVGDHFLKEFAGILQQSLREYEYIVRWGGEEFLILLPRADLRITHDIARRLQQGVRKHLFATVGRRSASFGIAQSRETETFDTLLSRADRALYRAKTNGRDCIEVSFHSRAPG